MFHKIFRKTFCGFLVFACAAVAAQDFGRLLKGVVNGRQPDLVGIIKSVAEVTRGQIASDVEGSRDAEGKVVLYRTSWCGYCKRAVAHMEKKNIPFVERDIEASSEHKAEYTRLGGKGPVPFLVFGNKTMQGFSTTAIDQNYAEFKRTHVVAQPTGNGPIATSDQVISEPVKEPPSETVLQVGDTLIGKIPGIKVLADAHKNAERLLVLGKTDEVVYMGEERGGFYLVTTTQGEGWIDKRLVKRH